MRRIALATLSLAALCALPATASAAADIEAVWSFSGGQVAVEAKGDGTFAGTVIRPTRFSHCVHPNGELMWADIRPQADGSYWGGHQFFRSSDCTYSERGNAAYRVLVKPDGGRYLRMCTAHPEQPESQPTIAPDGTSANAPAGCDDSDLVSALPSGTPGLRQIARLPGNEECRSRRSFRIRLREPRGDALRTARVWVNRRRVAVRKGERVTAPVDLRGLPRGRYTVRIVATTVRGRTIEGSRRYRTCSRKRRSGSGSPV